MHATFSTVELMTLYQQVEKLGTPCTTACGAGYCWQGLSVAPSFDGYSLYFMYADVTLCMGFHQQMHLDAPSAVAGEQFWDQLRLLYRQAVAASR